jgi:predicted Zn-dependent peptidase
MPDKQHQLTASIVTKKLRNGLTVCLIPMPGFRQVYTGFTTRYGSVDRTFRVGGKGDFITVPDGIAHFLEHKMFEQKEGDVFADFAAHGAAANAFTSFDQTTYLFTCTDDVTENLTILMNYVQDPYFTHENVEKEKGIIGQEIRMYDDNPDWRVYRGLREALFHKHPVRIEIAGTEESIAEIDKDTLYQCYETFYHPENMALVVAGGFDVDAVMTCIEDNQAAKSFSKMGPIERDTPTEPKTPFQKSSSTHLSVHQAQCLIGWKDPATGFAGRELMVRELLTGVVMDTLFGKGGDLYHELLDGGLIDGHFGWQYEISESYAYALAGGNSSDPDALVEAINGALEEAIREGLLVDAFERNRRKSLGQFTMSLDSPTSVGRGWTSYWLHGADVFDSIEVLESLGIKEANDRLCEQFAVSQQVVSTVLPK